MTYPYGTKGAPAVGGGLPGLPRRTVTRVTDVGPRTAFSDYKILTVVTSSAANIIQIQNYKGEVEASLEIPGGTPSAGVNLSPDRKLLFILGRSSSGTSLMPSMVINLESLELISKFTMANASTCYGIAGNSELMAVATGTGSTAAHVSIFRLEDVIARNGDRLWDTDRIDNFTVPTSTSQGVRRLDWNKQGDLILASTSTHINLIEYPSKIATLVASAESGISYASAPNRYQGFSGDGNYVCWSSSSANQFSRINRENGSYSGYTSLAFVSVSRVVGGAVGEANGVGVFHSIQNSNFADVLTVPYEGSPGEVVTSRGFPGVFTQPALDVSIDGRVCLAMFDAAAVNRRVVLTSVSTSFPAHPLEFTMVPLAPGTSMSNFRAILKRR